jgi:hypothetical protein
MRIIRKTKYCVIDSDGVIVAYFNSLADAIRFIENCNFA